MGTQCFTAMLKLLVIPNFAGFETSRDVQVWPGALLLADYILEHEKHFDGCVGMEVERAQALQVWSWRKRHGEYS